MTACHEGEGKMRTLTIAIAIGISAGAAAADTVRMEFDHTGAGRNVRMTVGGTSFNCFAGQLVHNFSNGSGAAAGLSGNHTTFCADLMQSVTSSGATYAVAGIQSLSSAQGMGAAKSQAIYDMYAFANGSQMGADADMAAAFQLAIWEVIYDYNAGDSSSLNLASGTLKAKNTNGSSLSGSILAKAAALFSAIGSNSAQDGLMGFSNGSYQDQIVQIVPVPAAALIGLAGLGLAGYARRRATR